MRNFLICLIFLCSLSAFSQVQWADEMGCVTCPPNIAPAEIPDWYKPNLHLPEAKPYNWKRGALTFGMGLVAGTAYGFHETAVHKPQYFPHSWNRQWWNGQISWQNKYRNGDPAQGPAYFGSTTIFVAPTDAKHTFGTIHRAALLGTGIVIGLGEKRPWWHYAADAVMGFAGYSIGFHSIYTYQIYGR